MSWTLECITNLENLLESVDKSRGFIFSKQIYIDYILHRPEFKMRQDNLKLL